MYVARPISLHKEVGQPIGPLLPVGVCVLDLGPPIEECTQHLLSGTIHIGTLIVVAPFLTSKD